MNERFLPLLWMVWLPLRSVGALPQPAVPARTAGVSAAATLTPAKASVTAATSDHAR